jgi:hypothetical protein
MNFGKVLLAVAIAIATGSFSPQESAGQGETPTLRAIEDAITELDLARAKALLDKLNTTSLGSSYERALLAVYSGDCETARIVLDAPNFGESKEAKALSQLARSCSGATAGGLIVDDQARGLWVRLQDEADRPLVPYLSDVADAARAAIARDLGVELPRPLRIDLVRDLFSLSAVTGLPLDAAETTGTVAVARWGRVTMLSPRATPLGYPWQDTLAHEITHLALSRATRDRAPLWLQEGIAKREETRWRAPRAFDDDDFDHVARAALKSGRSVGVDKLGPSIALLPTPEAASIAFAEVTSFMQYWIVENGDPALRLLLSDLKGLGSEAADPALRSVTGYDMSVWIRRWKQHLVASEPAPKPREAKLPPRLAKSKPPQFGDEADATRRLRLGDLLFSRGHSAAAAREIEPVAEAARGEPAVCWRAARALLLADRAEDAKRRLGKLEEMKGPHGPWFGLNERFAREAGDTAAAKRAFALGLALDPLAEEVGCEGRVTLPGAPPAADLPADLSRRALCGAARDLAARKAQARE